MTRTRDAWSALHPLGAVRAVPARRVGRWAACSACAPQVEWTPQPAQSGTYRAEYSWTGDAGHRRGHHLRPARLEPPALRGDRGVDRRHRGRALLRHPDLGVFHAVTGLHGDIMIPEDRLKAAVVKAALGETTLELEIDKLLGKPWDDELETFRHAGDGVAVRWLHQVV